MGACASKSKALKEGEGALVTLEEPPTEISKTSEAEQKQEEVKQMVDVADEAEVSGGGENGENNRKPLGVLMSEIEHPVREVKHPTKTTEDVKTIAEVETTEDDQAKAVNPVEKSAVIAEQSMEKVESETETLFSGLSALKKGQPEQDQSINSSPPQISQNEVEEESVDSAEKSAVIAEQPLEKVESKTRTLVAGSSVMKKEQPEQDQSINKVELNASPPHISQHEVEEQSVDLAEKSAIIIKQYMEKVEFETGSVIAEISETVTEQSEQDQFVKKIEFETWSAVAEMSKIVIGRPEPDQFVDKAEVNVSASTVVAEQHVVKVESVSDSKITETPTTVIKQSEQEQAVEKIEQKEGEKPRAEEPVDKFEPRTESVISETSITALEQPLEMTALVDEEPQISQKQAAITEEHKVERPVEIFEPKDEKPIVETAPAITVELKDRQTSESKSLSLNERLHL